MIMLRCRVTSTVCSRTAKTDFLYSVNFHKTGLLRSPLMLQGTINAVFLTDGCMYQTRSLLEVPAFLRATTILMEKLKRDVYDLKRVITVLF